MGGALSSQEDDQNLMFCGDNCCTDENVEQRRTLSGVMKTPRPPSESIRNPKGMSDEDNLISPESSWIGPHIEVQDGVVQLEDGTVLYMHDKQDEKRSMTSPMVQKSKRKQLLSVS